MTCRLCLYIFGEEDTYISSISTEDYVSSDYVLALSLIPELDLELSIEVVICKVCVETLKTFDEFMETCKVSDSRIASYRKQHGPITDLKNLIAVPSSSLENKSDVNCLVCCTCLKEIPSSKSRNLMDEPFLGKVLNKIMTMKNILTVHLPVLCMDCTDTLEVIYDFKSMCLNTQNSVQSHFMKTNKVLGSEDLICVAKAQGVKQRTPDMEVKLDRAECKIEQCMEPTAVYHNVKQEYEVFMCKTEQDLIEDSVSDIEYPAITIFKHEEDVQPETIAIDGDSTHNDPLKVNQSQPSDQAGSERGFQMDLLDEETIEAPEVLHLTIANDDTDDVGCLQSQPVKHKIVFLGQDFKCETCRIVTSCKHLMMRHINHEKDLRICHQCPGILLPHGKKSKQTHAYRCFFCEYVAYTKFQLRLHLSKHPERQVKWPCGPGKGLYFVCGVCGYSKKKKALIRIHMARTHSYVASPKILMKSGNWLG